MRVICINDKPIIDTMGWKCLNQKEPVKEGEIYEVVKEHKTPTGADGYLLYGFTPIKNQQRFIHLSEIDETEMVRESELINH